MLSDDLRHLHLQARLIREHAERCGEQVRQRRVESEARSRATRDVLDRLRATSAG